MSLSELLNEAFFTILEGIVILIIHLAVTNNKEFIKTRKIKALLFLVCYCVFSSWASLSLPAGYHTIVIVLFSILILSFITNSKLPITLISVIISSIYVLIIELIIVLISTMMLNINTEGILDNLRIKFYLSIISKSIEILLALLLYKKRKPIANFFPIQHKNTTVYYSLLGTFYMGIFIFSINYIINNNQSIYLYELLLFIIFFIYVILGILDHREKLKLMKFQQKFYLQKEYVNNLETIINIIRREKHDFANHINTIYAMCILNKPNTVERIREYLEKLVVSLKESYQFHNTGNDYIDGLLAVKSNFAYENNINLEVDFEEPLTYISINDNDLISIISNIIDNAFEAVFKKSKKEGRVVSVCGYVEDDIYHLSISNNGNMIPNEHLNKIFENGFSTKKDNKGDHGLGLYIVKQLVRKNDGEIIVSSNEEETEFLIKFKVGSYQYEEVSP